MKRVLLLIVAVVAVFALTACEENKKLTCTAGENVWEYVYNDEELLEYYFDGQLIEDGSTVEGMVMDYDAFVSLAGGIDAYIENTKVGMEDYFDATCEIEE